MASHLPEELYIVKTLDYPVTTGNGSGTRRGRPRPADAVGQVSASVITDDPVAADAVQAYLHTAADIRVLPRERALDAEVVVAVTTTPTEQLFGVLEEIHRAGVSPRQCMVLICDPLPERHLSRAFRYGVVSIVPRRSASREAIIHAVQASGRGSSVLSGPATRWLADQGRDFQKALLSSHGITAGGLTTREVDVLRLLADGLSTAEIAQQLNYAERTIKNVIADMLSRLQLRNRAQAVSYAYRAGAI